MTTSTPVSVPDKNLLTNIEKVLEKQIRPVLREHNGGIEITSFRENILSVRLLGQCTRCAAAALTFDQLIKDTLLSSIPELKDVLLDDSIPDDMLDFAEKILRHQIR